MKPLNTDNDNTSADKTGDELCVDNISVDTPGVDETCVDHSADDNSADENDAQSNDHSADVSAGVDETWVDHSDNHSCDNLGIKDREFFESVVAAYHDSDCSIRETATQMDISRSKVRKILITMGEITSDITEKALPLLAQGKPQKEVADILEVSVATLSTYLPYGNRVFNREDKTEDAIRSKEYRIRQKSAARRQVGKVRGSDKDELSGGGLPGDELAGEVPRLNYVVDHRIDAHKIVSNDLWKTKMEDYGMSDMDKVDRMDAAGTVESKEVETDMTDELDMTDEPDMATDAPDSLDDLIKVLKLKLELVMDEDDRDVVRKYGKAKDGISREIIVPYYYPLHALHYAIQKAFGWQNSHLHHFELPDNVFNKLTNDSFMKYCMLCGLLFRFPYSDADMPDIYWDDDYSEGKSFKTWLKSKYSAPYRYDGTLEHYMFSQIVAKRFWNENQTVKIGPSFDEYLKGNKGAKEVKISAATCEEMGRIFEGNLGEIVERSYINNVLCANPENDSFRAFRECEEIADDLDKEFPADMKELRELLSVGDELKAVKAKEARLSKRKNASVINLFCAINDAEKLEEKYHSGMSDLLGRTNVEMPPLTNELIYKYDYGDGWEVKITCEAEYLAGIKSGEVIGFYEVSSAAGGAGVAGVDSKDGDESADKTTDKSTITPMEKKLSDLTFEKVIVGGAPICVAADGLPVMDDVGGVPGYCDFLKCIKGGKDSKNDKSGEEGRLYEDPKESRDWARGMGWTGRMSKPENIL